MFDRITFKNSEGQRKEKKLQLFGLTTCSFCRKAKAFLDDNDFYYEYLFMEKIDPDLKKLLKEEYSSHFNKRMSYPTLIINEGEEILTGFIRVAWEKELLD